MQGHIEPKSHMEVDDSKGDSNMTVDSVDNGENQTSSKSLVGGGAPSLMKNNLSGDNDNDDDDEDEDENSQDWCPLFMDGLPTNFASNNALAAIASLLNDSGDDSNKNDDENKKGKVKVTPRKGGGKVSRRTARRNKNKTCQNSPYDLPAGRNGNGNENGNEESSKKSATMGEAQLFLSMWKI
eukprot:413754_1